MSVCLSLSPPPLEKTRVNRTFSVFLPVSEGWGIVRRLGFHSLSAPCAAHSALEGTVRTHLGRGLSSGRCGVSASE